MTSRRGTLAFVPPRFGTDVVGGSESVMREAAQGLAARGWDVEVLTTCARSHYTWANELPAGTRIEEGLTVARFPTVLPTDTTQRDHLERRVQQGLPLSDADERAWVNGLFRVPALYHHLLAHAVRYRAITLSPYLFWPTAVCGTIAPERTIVMPCLHDEPYARLRVFRASLAGAALGWFLADPERDLAESLGLAPATSVVTGAGVEVPDGYDAAGFRADHGLTRPFVLYAGRREGGKGWDELLAGYAEAVSRHGLELDLVTMGVGPVAVPEGLEHRVHDLGFVPAGRAPDAFAAAAALAQPSRNESFSRTVMEAWLAGTFVVANAESAVVRWHCERSGAGVTWRDREGLVAALELVAERPDVVAELARGGRDHVLAHYTWPTVLDRMEASLEELPWTG